MIEPLVLLLAALPTGLPTPAELQEEIVKARMAIRQGTITMRVETRGVDFNDDSPWNFDFENQFDFDGDRLRFDQMQTRPDGSLVERWSIVVEPTKFIDFFESTDPRLPSPRVFMGDREWMGGAHPEFHPRLIGVSTSMANSLANHSLETFFRRNNKSELVSEDTLDGSQVLRLEIDTGLANGCRVDYLVDPSQGYAIRRITTSFRSSRGDRISTDLEAKYRQWPVNGTWFLSESTRQLHRNSERIFEETIRILDAKFGIVPDAQRFEIASMDIPAGTTVQQNSRMLVWDGAALVSEVDEPRPREIPGSNWDWLYQPKAWIAGVSGSLAVLLALQYWRRRHAA